MPVMKRAGVTTKAGLATGFVSGAMATAAWAPLRSRPPTWRTSPPSRSSMGMRPPSGQAMSMVDNGAATKKGTPQSAAARAFR